MFKTIYSGLILLFALTSCAQNREQTVLSKKEKVNLEGYSQAVFASGCFWHTEALFDGMKGVVEAISGYAGGHVKNPTYEQVVDGNTGHAESVLVYYDSTQVTFPVLLKAYFEAQDPTDAGGQGPDRGPQYRSIAFYNNDAEQQMIEDYIRELNASGRYDKPIAVESRQLDKFWEAEAYHQEYARKHPNQPYVKNVCIKEVEKFRNNFPELMKQTIEGKRE